MKFLTIALLPTAALATSATLATRTVDITNLTKAVESAVASASACALSVEYYMDKTMTTSSLDTGCGWFDDQMLPPVEKILNATVVDASAADLAVLSQLQEPLTKMIGQFDRAVLAGASKQEHLLRATCEFYNKEYPNLGDNTVRVLNKIAAALEKGGQLPDIAKKLKEWAGKVDAAVKLVKPTCKGGAPASSSTSTSLKTGSFTSISPEQASSTPLKTGSFTSVNSNQPAKPTNIVTAAAAGFAPHLMVAGLIAVGGAVAML